MNIIRGRDIANHIEQLGRFRIEIFSEYPYLYDGDLEYERNYLSRYLRDSECILILMEDDKGIVGACTGIPLKYEDEAFKKPFSQENINEMFYIGEVMLRSDARGQGLGSALLSAALGSIDSGTYKKVFLCTVERGENHPRRPSGYISPDALWKKFGFEMDQDTLLFYRWKDLGDELETEKPMHVWIKELEA